MLNLKVNKVQRYYFETERTTCRSKSMLVGILKFLFSMVKNIFITIHQRTSKVKQGCYI